MNKIYGNVVGGVVSNTGGGTVTNQVQSDWAQTNSSRVDYIKNKPELKTVANTGLISDLEEIWDTQIIFDGGDADVILAILNETEME